MSTDAPDHIDMPEIEWQETYDAYMESQEVELSHSEYLIHQDGFAAGWTLGQEQILTRNAELESALRAIQEAPYTVKGSTDDILDFILSRSRLTAVTTAPALDWRGVPFPPRPT